MCDELGKPCRSTMVGDVFGTCLAVEHLEAANGGVLKCCHRFPSRMNLRDLRRHEVRLHDTVKNVNNGVIIS